MKNVQWKGPSLWHHHDFLKLWSGETVSLLGDQFTALAFPLVAVVILGASSAQMGILQALTTLPFLLFGLLAGVWADRYRRRRLMIASDISRALLLISVPAAYILSMLSIPLLYLVSFTTGVFTTIFDISYQAYLPSLVDRELLTDANGKLQASSAVASVAGPGIAGVVIQLISAPFAIFLDSFSFIWSALSLSWIRRGEEQVGGYAKQEHGPILKEMMEGLVLVLRETRLRAIAACTATANLFTAMIFAVIILYAVQQLGMNALSLGVMFAMGSVGTLLGALAAGKLAVRLALGRTIVLSVLVGAIGWAIVIVAAPANGFLALVTSFFIGNFGAVVYNVNQVSFRQALVPVKLQGRLNATMRFIVWGTLPLGSLIGGYVGQVTGLHAALVVGGVGGFLAVPIVFFSPVRQVKEIPMPNDNHR